MLENGTIEQKQGESFASLAKQRVKNVLAIENQFEQ